VRHWIIGGAALVAITLAAILAWRHCGEVGVAGVAGGGLLAFLLGRRRLQEKPLPATARDELADQLDAGLKATEAKAAAEKAVLDRQTKDAIAAADAALEEKANARDPDPLAWTRGVRRARKS